MCHEFTHWCSCSSLSEPESFLQNPFVWLSFNFICFAFSYPLFCHHFQLSLVCSLTAQIQLAPFTRCSPSNDSFVQSGWWLKAVIIMHVSRCSHSLSLHCLIALYSDWKCGSRVLPLQWRTPPSSYPPIYPPTLCKWLTRTPLGVMIVNPNTIDICWCYRRPIFQTLSPVQRWTCALDILGAYKNLCHRSIGPGV